MSGSQKITSSHRSRLALIYVRQSTLLQVRENTESTARQYGLADRARELGWSETSISVVDADLGVSGRFSGLRAGFQQLVARVCLGEVGAVFGLEVSRLARSSAEFGRLLEFARLTDTLLIDADGVYDLADFNDRLVLGLKSTMSEAELHILAGRLHGARKAAAGRGDLQLPLPVGMVYDDDGLITVDPDEEVQTAVADVFALFDQHGSALGVVRAFAGRRFPRRDTGVWDGRLGWGRLTHGRAASVLKNPAYAGAYVFGRAVSTRKVRPDGTVVTHVNRRPRDQWAVLIPDHHEGYISWQRYLQIESRLAANRTSTGARPPREGPPVCQGIIFCGSCGFPMNTRYRRADGTADYVCTRARSDAIQTPGCHSIAAAAVDPQVVRVLLAALVPEQVHLALSAADEVHHRHQRSHRAAELAVERARYEADRAERAFGQVEPENRLVARSLESRWEARLTAVAQAETALADLIAAEPALPQPARLQQLTRDLPELWQAPTTTAKDRKRLLRTLIADVTMRHVDNARAHIGVRWHTGAVDEITCDRRTNRNPTQAVDIVRELLKVRSDAEIAEHLNSLGFKTGNSRPFTVNSIRHIRQQHAIGSKRNNPTGPGEITVPQAALILGIHEAAIYPWIRSGEMVAHQARNRRWCIPWDEQIETCWKQHVAESHHLKRRANTNYETGQAV
ncbi:recombinase family protein [Streptomyces sp. NPDC058304]|uniref:recombinase family protein n=1 Tax=Streptomyces sp. NPDC058304 TaxID=3346437 RepID=UPI0036E2A17D